ncbi:RNase P subunit Rpr2 [Encephalitozoon intestinalis ATCC 50506]|uniref:RNase P subunit Rpr2 n=1 Tax=Encephalitozoon intestinalis (strain ATCC 50506) TaxID=876142 RepID=E0S9V6_ENCIT|nr:RNase P subunit Rpr2 [Encephalitozoon intestinalis ATCC 50506]ADM12491.1 RNase P subunit Rpr2 [Encephalitozoon intestinalis ATCC 50506]UTX46328.1 RNAase P component 4 [Encephalitozoon intestinalis]
MKKDFSKHLKYLYITALNMIGIPSLHRRKTKKMKMISNKYQVRLSREIKRTLCSTCLSILVPGFNCTSRIVRKENGLCLKTVCGCGSEKIFVAQGR